MCGLCPDFGSKADKVPSNCLWMQKPITKNVVPYWIKSVRSNSDIKNKAICFELPETKRMIQINSNTRKLLSQCCGLVISAKFALCENKSLLLDKYF